MNKDLRILFKISRNFRKNVKLGGDNFSRVLNLTFCYRLRRCQDYTLIEHSSRPMNTREVIFFFYWMGTSFFFPQGDSLIDVCMYDTEDRVTPTQVGCKRITNLF